MTEEARTESEGLAHDLEARLRVEARLALLNCDPLAFALAAWPWGEGELANDPGPDGWQTEALAAITEGFKTSNIVQLAIASGHGVGKSAFISLVTEFVMQHANARGIVTANTGKQLETKTWPEVAKWHRLCLLRDRLEWRPMSLRASDPDLAPNWRCDAVTWSEDSPAAFAGLHNAGGWILLVMDEASEIPPIIWETVEGAMTDADAKILWIACGNRTQPTGRFVECFGKFKHRWRTFCVDARKARKSNKELIERWRQDYGEDSDFFRVRVLGEAPAVAAQALFSEAEIVAAMGRHLPVEAYSFAGVALGVDVARQGDDETVLAVRQGLYVHPLRPLRVPDATLVAAHVAQVQDTEHADVVCVDGTGGYGAGVVDCLRQVGRHPVEVQFAGKADDPRFANKRSEMAWAVRAHLRSGGALPKDEALKEEMLAQTYAFKGDKFQLCSKDEVKDAIGRSPDRFDALGLTFAVPVAPRLDLAHPLLAGQQTARRYDVDRDPLS